MAVTNGSLAFVPDLSPADGGVLASLLVLCLLLATIFALLGHKTPIHFFLSGRRMRPVPAGISAGITALPAASFLAFPDAAFVSGCGVALAPFCGSLSFLLVSAFAIEVLRPLKMDSLGAYFFARFRSRTFVAFADLLAFVCVLPCVGFHVFDAMNILTIWSKGRLDPAVAIAVFSLVVIVSASIGGFRSIVWTEVLLSAVLLAGGLAIIFGTVMDTPGGMGTILRLNADFGHFALPTTNHSLFTLTLAIFVAWGLAAVQPSNVQRLCSTATRREAYLVATTAAATLFALSMLSIWSGVNVFGFFANRGCDVLAAMPHKDVVVIYAERALLGPGCRGLILAALFVEAICYFAAGINAVAAILWKDLLSKRYFRHAAHRSALLVSKILSLGCGVLAMLSCYFFLYFLPSVEPLSTTFVAALWGPYLGVFLFVATFPKANPLGVAVSVTITCAVTFWLGFLGMISSDCTSSSSADLSRVCTNNSSSVNNSTVRPVSKSPTSIFCVSPLWLAPFSLLLTMLISLFASLLCCARSCRRRGTGSRVGDEAMPRGQQDSDCLYVSLSTIEH